jgi:hypothetical protein
MRRFAVLLAAVLAPLAVTSCAEANIGVEDAYSIGCPAVDAAVAGGGVAGKATAAGLKKLSESGQLDPEPQKFVDATISLLESDDPNRASDGTKQLIIDGCSDHGYPLRNLK